MPSPDALVALQQQQRQGGRAGATALCKYCSCTSSSSGTVCTSAHGLHSSHRELTGTVHKSTAPANAVPFYGTLHFDKRAAYRAVTLLSLHNGTVPVCRWSLLMPCPNPYCLLLQPARVPLLVLLVLLAAPPTLTRPWPCRCLPTCPSAPSAWTRSTRRWSRRATTGSARSASRGGESWGPRGGAREGCPC